MPPVESVAAIPNDLILRLSIEQYHAIIQAGILTDDDSVELLEGWLVFKRPKNPLHRVTTRLVRTALENILPPGWYVDSQEPIALSNSEPEPDIVVVRGNTRQYLDRHPGAEDIALIVEVSDTTLQRDRTVKKRIYARAGIAIYWIVNLVEGLVEVYSQPLVEVEQPDYSQRLDFGRSAVIPIIIEGIEIGAIAVNSLLP
ncbi:Uma2 family endonuclease [Tychonema sp. LEGE 07199]|uniref:Uma2 family endonuclease n=1 Tax=unclassified Tychonema TaxID=2642144 RepID=UPI00187FE59B|nr:MULTISPECIES: Uma2 family endonuclease [unclassified Tychonema]MBE9119446.1 Uma2 family endonuclease [Tychonema sp. LEGE 07199]MBE9131008.1 Uma2 family endonuclease [Tychonema sp. LEGE 07196]